MAGEEEEEVAVGERWKVRRLPPLLSSMLARAMAVEVVAVLAQAASFSSLCRPSPPPPHSFA